MRCAACNQDYAGPTDQGHCPVCGAPCPDPERSRQVFQLYAITWTFFASVLVYGIFVLVLETTGFTPIQVAAQVHVYLLAVAVALLGVMFVAEKQLLARQNAAAVWSATLVTAGLCEGIVLLGLVAYLLGSELQWVALFLGLGLVGFVYLSFHLPWYVSIIERDNPEL